MRLPIQIALLLFALPMHAAPALGQHTTAAAQATQVGFGGNLNLRFSRDGSLLRVIGQTPDDTTQKQHVRAVTYAAQSRAVLHLVNLPPDTAVLSTTSDGATAIVSTGNSTDHASLFLLNTSTGQRQPIPDSWYDPGSDLDASLSGDGRLVSIYSEDGSATPMIVNVYDWATKTLIATRRSEYVSAGGIVDGGVTEDGEAEFDGNRVGSTIVDLKTGRVMAQFGPSSMRSPNGAWQIEFPNLNWDESAPREVQVKNGATGQVIGKLDYTVADNEIYGTLTGAFCGTSPRFILAGGHSLAVYALPSGKLLTEIPAASWRDPAGSGYPALACSPNGKQVATLDGSRLTFHRIK